MEGSKTSPVLPVRAFFLSLAEVCAALFFYALLRALTRWEKFVSEAAHSTQNFFYRWQHTKKGAVFLPPSSFYTDCESEGLPGVVSIPANHSVPERAAGRGGASGTIAATG